MATRKSTSRKEIMRSEHPRATRPRAHETGAQEALSADPSEDDVEAFMSAALLRVRMLLTEQLFIHGTRGRESALRASPAWSTEPDESPSAHIEGTAPRRIRSTLELAEDVLENPGAWLRTPNPQLGDRKPIELVGTDEDYKVFNLLNAVDQGLF